MQKGRLALSRGRSTSPRVETGAPRGAVATRDGVARAGSASAQVPMGKPRERVGARLGATPVPGATTPTGCPTLTTCFLKLYWVCFRV